jgi:hypothetical protein
MVVVTRCVTEKNLAQWRTIWIMCHGGAEQIGQRSAIEEGSLYCNAKHDILYREYEK